MKTIWNRFLRILCVATAVSCVPVMANAAQLKAGDTFPALEKFSLEGKLPDGLKGKIVLVDFFASWCAPCKASFPALNEIHEKYGAKGLVIVAVNVDEKRSNLENFLKKHPAQFAVVRDGSQKLVAAAQVETMPTSFLLDGSGRVRFVHSGYHGDETKKQYLSEIETLIAGRDAKP